MAVGYRSVNLYTTALLETDLFQSYADASLINTASCSFASRKQKGSLPQLL